MRYKLFTTQFCHKCPSMKEFMASQDKVPGDVVNASVPEGFEEAKKFGVTSVPCVVFVDDAGEEVKRCGCREEVEEFFNTL
jgi:predicted DsbA family dithiol-disulfide isomerase